MPRFAFRFETLLNHRRTIEQDRQRELAKHLRSRMILQNELRSMQQTITDAKAQATDRLVGRVDLDAIARIGAYAHQSQARGQQIVLRLAHLERQIDQARMHLLDAVRQRKALEVLRDRQEEQWRTDQNRAEARASDEMAMQAHARRMMTEAAR